MVWIIMRQQGALDQQRQEFMREIRELRTSIDRLAMEVGGGRRRHEGEEVLK
ncbi:MAG: hypothetical protein HC901_04365 [Bdellovibrionaceae bacterium]|nr:hypothetical protein [Pseudobdellovibrionaceae bacterium]